MDVHLKVILDKYKTELITDDAAKARLKWITDKQPQLKKRLTKMERLKPTTQHSADGSRIVAPGAPRPVHDQKFGRGHVKSLTSFHETQIKNVVAIDRQAELVVQMRQWIYRQGFTVSPSGEVILRKDKAKLKYDTELEQQALTRISVQGGLLLDRRGTPFDTRKMVTAQSGPGWCIYVMSAENNLHVSTHSVGARHHSSLLAGGSVACAGEMQVVDGRLIALSNKSGHYLPPPCYLTQVVRVLAEGGVDPTSYPVIEWTSHKDTKTHSKASLFMDTQVFPAWPDNDVLVSNPNYASAHAEAVYAEDSDLDEDDDGDPDY